MDENHVPASPTASDVDRPVNGHMPDGASPARHVALARRWVPAVAREFYNRLTGRAIVYDRRFEGWEEAKNAAGGYDQDDLVERLRRGAMDVASGKADWEQDGVTRSFIPADIPQLAGFAQVALHNRGRLSVLDFGGGLGSSYHQCRAYLGGLALNSLRSPISENRTWNVMDCASIQRSRTLSARPMPT
jgi:hypothetical protein